MILQPTLQPWDGKLCLFHQIDSGKAASHQVLEDELSMSKHNYTFIIG